ncbi:MAG: PAS domain-containing protein, partial [bacterium]|nr:PAS domain-containing protein [bacterium]
MTQDKNQQKKPEKISLTVNRDLVCRSINQQGALILGKSPVDCLNKPIRDLFPGNETQKFINALLSLFSTGIDLYLHTSFDLEQNNTQYELTITPVKDEYDNIVLAKITASEIFDIERIFKKAAEVEILRKMSGALAAVAHEVNNPLSVVLGYAEILLLDKSLDDSVTEKIKAVKEHADRIKKLIIQMTDISQVKTKSYILGSEILDIQNSSDPEAVLKKSILIVDKSKDNGLQYSSILLNDGYNANYAKDEGKAKTLIKNNYYPIIIMDNTIFSNNLIGSIKVIHQI